MTDFKKIAIMQPYFLPYMGYWQLINDVDEFVLYDNIQYTKKGWINRNRFLQNGSDAMFSIALKKDSDYLKVKDRFLADAFDREKIIRQFQGAYSKAPFYAENFSVIEKIILFSDNNLFNYIENSVSEICTLLNIKTPIIKSSNIESGHANVSGQDKVINICHAQNATHYINPIGGVDLYDKNYFLDRDIVLSFIKSQAIDYDCFGVNSIPYMSILDIIMFHSRDDIIELLKKFERVEP